MSDANLNTLRTAPDHTPPTGSWRGRPRNLQTHHLYPGLLPAPG